jgi:hypothetical protein
LRWLSTSKTLKIAPPAAKGLSQIDITIFRSADQFPQHGCAAPPIAPSELINAPRKPRVLVASKQELHMKCTNSDGIPFPGAAASAAFRRWWCLTTTSGWYSPLQPGALARPTASMSSAAGEQRARSKYRIEASDVEESPSSKGPCLRPEYTPRKQMTWREM